MRKIANIICILFITTVEIITFSIYAIQGADPTILIFSLIGGVVLIVMYYYGTDYPESSKFTSKNT